MKALLIPVEGPLVELDLPAENRLEELQRLVGGYIEAVPVPYFVNGFDRATSYVNEEGKYIGLPANMRATDFMVPGVGIGFGDVIAGPMLLCGFDPATGDTADVPAGVVRRARLIESEAG